MRILLAIACLSLLLLLLPARAADVYRWTDANGQVHFGQRPPPGGAERIDPPDSGTLNTYGSSELDRRRERERRLLESYEYERTQRRAREARDASEREAAAAECRRLQKYWRSLSHPGPVYIKREDGGRDYMSDERRAAEKERLTPAYERLCGRKP